MKLFVKSLFLFSLTLFASTAFGQNTIWFNNSTDTSFENAANWNNGIPAAGINAYVVPNGVANANGDFTVTQGGLSDIVINAASSHASASLNITNDIADNLTNGTVTMTFAGGTTYTLSGDLSVRDAETLTYSGNMVVGGAVEIGTVNGGTFTLASGQLDNSTGSGIDVGGAIGGIMTQSGNSSVIAGAAIRVGNLGNGSYILNDSSSLSTGVGDATQITIGSGAASQGILTLNDSSSLTVNSGADFAIGAGGNGTVTQAGANTVVTLNNGTSMEIGNATASTGVYNLQGGTLNFGTTGTDVVTVDLGVAMGASGSIIQTGGTLTAQADTTVTIGDNGTGSYQLSGGTADFQSGLTLGASAMGNGTVTQSGGTLTVENAPVTIGVVGTGTYTMTGGSATFADGFIVGANGVVAQTGGTMQITGGNLSIAAGTSFSMGGTLETGDNLTGGGRLDFAGGRLVITGTTGGTFTDSMDSESSGTTTIDASTIAGINNVNLTGAITGSAGFNFLGDGGTTFTLGNVNNDIEGPLSISTGTLVATQTDVASTSALTIGPGGTMNLTLDTGGLGYGGTLSGPGTLNLSFTTTGDALVLRTATGFSGAVQLGANGTAGKLEVFNGTFNSITGGPGAGGQSSLVIGPDLGTGLPLLPYTNGAIAPTTGTVTLGNATYTGLTTIAPNFTLNAGALSGEVTNSGTLLATGSGALTNNGTLGLSRTSAIGSTFAVSGDLTSNAGATILIRASSLSGAELADTFAVSGITTLDANSIVKLTGTGNFTNQTLLVAGATTIPIIQSSLLFKPVVAIDGAGLELVSASETPVGTFAMTPNESATAAPIDALIAHPAGLTAAQQASLARVVAVYNGFTAGSQIATQLASSSPQSLQYARDIAYDTANMMVQRMGGLDANMRAGYGGLDTSAMSVVNPAFNNGLGRSLKSFFASDSPAFHKPAPNGVNYYPGGSGGSISDSGSPETTSSSSGSTSSSTDAPAWHSDSQVIRDNPNPYLANQHPDSPDVPALSEFIAGDAVLAELNQDQGAANAPSSKAHFVAGDVTAGVGFRVTNHFTAGVLFDYNHTDAHTDDSGSKTKVDTYSPGLFATYFDHGFYANGLFSFGYNTYKNQRVVDELGTASSSPNGQQYVGGLDLGYDFHPTKDWVAGPMVGLTYTHLDIDSFTETGADGADLHVQDQSTDSLRTRLGGHVIYQTNTGEVLLQPSLGISWQHEFLADSDGITSNFSDLGSQNFTINTIAPSRDSALITLGLDATLSNSMVLYVGYLADVGSSNYYAQSVVAGLKARF